jgi:hypothetical protein
MDIYLRNVQARISLDYVFYAIFDALRDLADAGSMLDNYIEMNYDLSIDIFDIETALKVGAGQVGSHILARVFGCHPNNAITFEHHQSHNAFDSTDGNLNPAEVRIAHRINQNKSNVKFAE